MWSITNPTFFIASWYLLLQFPIQGNMLIDGQRLPSGMARDQLQFGVGQSRMAGQPRNCLMPESVRRSLHPGFFCIHFDDLLDSPRGILRVSAGLEQPPIVRMSRSMGTKGGREARRTRRTCP